MSVSTTWKEQGRFPVYEGFFSIAEFLFHFTEIRRDSRYDSIKYSIVDFTNADFSKLEVEDGYFATAVDYHSKLSYSEHLFALVTNDPHALKILKNYKNEMLNLGMTWKIEFFAAQAEARKWVNA